MAAAAPPPDLAGLTHWGRGHQQTQVQGRTLVARLSHYTLLLDLWLMPTGRLKVVEWLPRLLIVRSLVGARRGRVSRPHLPGQSQRSHRNLGTGCVGTSGGGGASYS